MSFIQTLKSGTLPFLKKHWGKCLIVLFILLPIISLIAFLATPPKPEVVSDTARRGDLIQVVEGVGTVISEKDLELKFPVSGIVSEVFVDEGDAVQAGQELARLRSEPTYAARDSALASLRSAQAEHRALAEGARPEDIAITRAELQNKEASLRSARESLQIAEAKLSKAETKLERLHEETRVSLSGFVQTSQSTISQRVSKAVTELKALDDVFSSVDIEHILVQGQPVEYSLIVVEQEAAEIALASASNMTMETDDYREALSKLRFARDAVAKASAVISRSYDFVANLDITGRFTFGVRENFKDDLSTARSNTQDALAALDTAVKSLQDASANFETQIAAEEQSLTSAEGVRDQARADILTFETAVRISRAQLALKEAGTRKADLDASWARVQKAKADYARAEADVNDTILRSPIDATVTKVNLKAGEFTPGQFSETAAAMTILGQTPYRMEFYAAEIDIPHVRLGQSGTVLLDAYPGQDIPLTVSEIDPAATSIDGVSKYRVALDFTSPPEGLKIGMTGDIDVKTGEVLNAILVPVRAVLTRGDGVSFIRMLDGNDIVEREVTVGERNDTEMVIREGVEEDEEVVVLVKEK